MIRSVSCVLAAASLAAAPQPRQVFRGTTDTVRVFTTVIAQDGRLVTNLTRDDFEIRDEGKPQPLTVFDNAPVPIRLVVMLDVSGSMVDNLPLLRSATTALLLRLGPRDVARIGTFGKGVNISPEFTGNARELLRALPDVIPPYSGTPLWIGLTEALEAFTSPGDGRSVILVLTDGKDTYPSTKHLRTPTQEDVTERARLEDVMIYAVGMRAKVPPVSGPPKPLGQLEAFENPFPDLPDPGLARIAADVGGGYTPLRNDQDLGAVFARVLDELHSQYLLGYAPPKRDGKRHDVDVRVKGKGMTARARKSYVAPKG